MIVAAGTKNPAKLAGIRNAFTKYFPDLVVKSVDSSAIGRPQPVGLEQMAEGALARARHALSIERADYGVGVEAGLFRIGTAYFDHQQAAIVDQAGRASLGHSAGYMLPGGVVEKLLAEGRELEHFAERISGVPQIGDKGGLIHHLSRGKMTRAELTEQCVVTALVPWLHQDVYHL